MKILTSNEEIAKIVYAGTGVDISSIIINALRDMQTKRCIPIDEQREFVIFSVYSGTGIGISVYHAVADIFEKLFIYDVPSKLKNTIFYNLDCIRTICLSWADIVDHHDEYILNENLYNAGIEKILQQHADSSPYPDLVDALMKILDSEKDVYDHLLALIRGMKRIK